MGQQSGSTCKALRAVSFLAEEVPSKLRLGQSFWNSAPGRGNSV